MQHLILAAEEGDATAVILPAAPELIYGFIAFAIVFGVLSRLVFPRMNTMLAERGEQIQGRMEEAEQARQEAEQTRREYQEQMDEARGEATQIIEDARATAEQLRRDIVAKAETEAEHLVSRARTDAEAERERVLQNLREEVGTLSVELASRIVGRELDESAHRELVDDYIGRLSRQN